MKFNNITEAIILHNSMMMKYSNVLADEIRFQLIESLNFTFIGSIILNYNESFNYLKTMMFHYESNQEQWSKICSQICALHQSLILFQQFILKINQNIFAEAHMKINNLKTEIVNKLVQLTLFTLNEYVSEYVKKELWKGKDSFRSTIIIQKLVKELKRSSTQELAKLILSYTSQEIVKTIEISLREKEIDSNAIGKFIHLLE